MRGWTVALHMCHSGGCSGDEIVPGVQEGGGQHMRWQIVAIRRVERGRGACLRDVMALPKELTWANYWHARRQQGHGHRIQPVR